MCQPKMVNKNHRNSLRPQNPLQLGFLLLQISEVSKTSEVFSERYHSHPTTY